MTDPADRSRRRRRDLVVLGVALTSGAVALVSSWRGIGITPFDSLAYLTMADEVAGGRMPYPPPVLGTPATHFPPGWSLLVGVLSALAPGADPMAVARVVNAAFAASLPVVVYGTLRSKAAHAPWIPVLFAAYVAASYPMFELASRAVVEPMFLCLLLLSLMGIDRVRRARSMSSLVKASALVGALILTRYVGVAVLFPLGLAALVGTSSRRRRLERLAVVGIVALAPIAVWYVLAPGSLGPTHIKASQRVDVGGNERAGVAELLLTIKEAGITVARGVFLPSTVRYALGLALLLAPVVAVIATGVTQTADGTRRRRVADSIRSCGTGAWLWFLVTYTALIAAQRWYIDREIIARYWLPYWIVAAVVVGWCVIEWAGRRQRAWHAAVAAAGVSLLVLAAYNSAQIAATAPSNARDGVTLNAVQYRESDLLGSLAEGGLDVVYADDTELVAFQSYARGALVRVERLSCQVELVDSFVAELRSAMRRGVTPAVAILGRCRDGAFADKLVARFDGATVLHDSDLGVVLLPAG